MPGDRLFFMVCDRTRTSLANSRNRKRRLQARAQAADKASFSLPKRAVAVSVAASLSPGPRADGFDWVRPASDARLFAYIPSSNRSCMESTLPQSQSPQALPVKTVAPETRNLPVGLAHPQGTPAGSVWDTVAFKTYLQRLEGGPTRSFTGSAALLLASVDRFESICCGLGINVGKQLALCLVQRLLQVLSENAITSVLRDGEMAVLLKGDDVSETGIRLAERIRQSLQRPFVLGDREIYLTVSTGIALSGRRQHGVGTLIEDARLALLHAQSQGYDRHCLFADGLRSQLRERLQLENDLRRGLQHREFLLHYQPIFSLERGEIVGFEALVRWKHPHRGLVPPGEFIPIAEETGLIQPLGMWVLAEACQQMRRWQNLFPAGGVPTMSVNLSSQQLAQPNLLAQIDRILLSAGLESRYLRLEITETALIENADAAVSFLQQLEERGIQLCIDDFGTGYSSLSYLQRFPARFLKLDRSLTAHVARDRRTAGILKAVMALARHLNMSVIAEGLEQSEQLQCLQAMDCAYGQGFLFFAPLAANDAERLLADLFGPSENSVGPA